MHPLYKLKRLVLMANVKLVLVNNNLNIKGGKADQARVRRRHLSLGNVARLLRCKIIVSHGIENENRGIMELVRRQLLQRAKLVFSLPYGILLLLLRRLVPVRLGAELASTSRLLLQHPCLAGRLSVATLSWLSSRFLPCLRALSAVSF